MLKRTLIRSELTALPPRLGPPASHPSPATQFSLGRPYNPSAPIDRGMDFTTPTWNALSNRVGAIHRPKTNIPLRSTRPWHVTVRCTWMQVRWSCWSIRQTLNAIQNQRTCSAWIPVESHPAAWPRNMRAGCGGSLSCYSLSGQ